MTMEKNVSIIPPYFSISPPYSDSFQKPKVGYSALTEQPSPPPFQPLVSLSFLSLYQPNTILWEDMKHVALILSFSSSSLS